MTTKPNHSIEYRRCDHYPCELKVVDSCGNENKCDRLASYFVQYFYGTKWGVFRSWGRRACEPCARLWARRYHLHFPERKPPGPQEGIGRESGV